MIKNFVICPFTEQTSSSIVRLAYLGHHNIHTGTMITLTSFHHGLQIRLDGTIATLNSQGRHVLYLINVMVD